MEWADYKAKVKEALEKSKFDVAETTLLQALQWVKDTGGSNERLCLCLDQLAWIYVNIRDLDRAAACYKESLETKKSILGEQNPIVARACKKMATVVYMQKRYDLAEKYSKDALNIFKQTLGVEHEETLQTLLDLVSLLRKMNRNIEANILEKMGRQQGAAAPQQEQTEKSISMSQTFLRIKVCVNCGLPYDGEFCMRCTEGRLVAHQKTQQVSSGKPGPQTPAPPPPPPQSQSQNRESPPFHPQQNFQQHNDQQQPTQNQQHQVPQGSQPQPFPDHLESERHNAQHNNSISQNPQQPQPQPFGQSSQSPKSHDGQPQNQFSQPQFNDEKHDGGQLQPQQISDVQNDNLKNNNFQNEQHGSNQAPQLQQAQPGQPQQQNPHDQHLPDQLPFQQHQQFNVSQEQEQHSPQNPGPNLFPPPGNSQQSSQPWPQHPPGGFPGPSGQNSGQQMPPLPAVPPQIPGAPPNLVPQSQSGQFQQPAAMAGFGQAPDSGLSGSHPQMQVGQALGTTGGFQVQSPSGFGGGAPQQQQTDGGNLHATGGFQQVHNPDVAATNQHLQQTADGSNSDYEINLESFPQPESLSATGGFMQVARPDHQASSGSFNQMGIDSKDDYQQAPNNERPTPDLPAPPSDVQQ
ncbi:MAG: tetratricopeptide repeat protein [Candidatus Melainabacteria bacterium]|nr:tetratricopeptide repeat protein [Candidatus Melainabacteria bacterium]